MVLGFFPTAAINIENERKNLSVNRTTSRQKTGIGTTSETSCTLNTCQKTGTVQYNSSEQDNPKLDAFLVSPRRGLVG